MQNLKIIPISMFKSIWYFVFSSFLLYIGFYVFIPLLLSKDIPFFIAYLIFHNIPHILLFSTALILYKKEGNVFNISNFKARIQFKSLNKIDWIWIIVIILGWIIASGLLEPIINKIAQIPFFKPPDFFPAEINPNKSSIPGYMFDYKLSGQYWVIIAYFVLWFFNIFGEELLFRGILFPRQIEKYGSKTWIYHGIIWGLWHCYWKWQLILFIPFTLLFSYAVYKRKNILIGIISHGLLNAFPLLMIIIQVLN